MNQPNNDYVVKISIKNWEGIKRCFRRHSEILKRYAFEPECLRDLSKIFLETENVARKFGYKDFIVIRKTEVDKITVIHKVLMDLFKECFDDFYIDYYRAVQRELFNIYINIKGE